MHLFEGPVNGHSTGEGKQEKKKGQHLAGFEHLTGSWSRQKDYLHGTNDSRGDHGFRGSAADGDVLDGKLAGDNRVAQDGANVEGVVESLLHGLQLPGLQLGLKKRNFEWLEENLPVSEHEIVGSNPVSYFTRALLLRYFMVESNYEYD